VSEAVDSLDFLGAVEGLPEQLSEAHARANDQLASTPLSGADEIRNIAVLGMGGSGISGDVLSAVASGALPVPVNVLKQIRVPGFVGPATLVFAVSYSGNTEETLSMTSGALQAGARVVAISNGGELARLATEHGAIHVPAPDGYLPRAALGALIAPMFVCLGRIGMLDGVDDMLHGAVVQLGTRRDECKPDVPAAKNVARDLARRIGRTIPLIYGGGALGNVAAMRWKCDVNENAKAPAFWSMHPELDHNEICGWGQHGDVTRQVFTLLELRHSFEHERLEQRFAFTRSLIEEAVVQVLELRAAGANRLAQVLDLMYVGDWTSCYLALDNDVDPGPIDAIARLKEALAEAPSH
jgi:glucose/mannose-6-phosphate isomerase